MRLRIALLTLVAAAGVFASIAVAKPPQGHGNPHDQTTTAASTTGTTTGTTATTTTTAGRKVLVCHKVGNGHYVLISVSVHSAPARGKHGDVPASNGSCPGPIQGHTGTTTTVAKTTTTAATTTATTATTTTTGH